MYSDFVSAITAGADLAPAIVARNEAGWYVFNPTASFEVDGAPHLLINEDGTLMPLNKEGTQVLCTYMLTGGNA